MTYPAKPFTNTPPGWQKVDALLAAFVPPSTFGFQGDAGDLNRFRSRYRVAKSFQEVALTGYTTETANGYSSLFRVFLVWSAFDQFMNVTGYKPNTIAAHLAPYHPGEMARSVRAIRDYRTFLSAILQELQPGWSNVGLSAFLDAKSCNVLAIPAAIRHIFAHGKLTPNSGSGHARVANDISNVVCNFMFTAMDGEFCRRLKAHGVAV